MQKKKIILAIFSFLLVCILSVVAYFYHSYQTIKEENDNVTSYTDKGENLELEEAKQYKETSGITNILLLGIDDRGTQEASRADTIMILTLDNNNKNIKLTSIMRDTYVEIPGHGFQKVNHAFAYGGVNLLAQTIKKNFEINLEQYVKIDFNGFKDLANSVGGLDVKISNYEEVNELNRCILLEIHDDPKSDLKKVKAIIDSAGLLALREDGAPLIKENPKLSNTDYNYIYETAGFIQENGEVHLSGTQLLAYSRMRHVGKGDSERNERQRNVVNLLIAKLKDTPQIKYLSIAKKLLPYVKTNINIVDALNLAYTTYKINNFAMEQLQIPVTKLSDGRIYKNKGWVLLMDREKNRSILNDFIFNNIKYNEANYSAFNYKNSEYYYTTTVIKKPSNELINKRDTVIDVTEKPTEVEEKEKVEENTVIDEQSGVEVPVVEVPVVEVPVVEVDGGQ